MDKAINIKARLQEIKSRPIGLPYEIKPPEAASLIREREILLKIAIALEEQNQYLVRKMEIINQLGGNPIIHPANKSDYSEESVK